jgi:hypothetical protein
MLTLEGAQHFIDDLKKQLAEQNTISLRKVRQAPTRSTHEGMNPPYLERR